MGMDVYGEAPKDERGKYFQNSCWSWRPLWNFVCEYCNDVLTEKDHNAGHYNDGYLIEKQRAERIAKRLRELCASGRVLDFEREYKLHMDSIPDELADSVRGLVSGQVAKNSSAPHGSLPVMDAMDATARELCDRQRRTILSRQRTC